MKSSCTSIIQNVLDYIRFPGTIIFHCEISVNFFCVVEA